MKNSRTVRRPSRRTNTTAGKILSAGLATATCVGLVGVIGVRTAEENAAKAADQATVDSNAIDLAAATTSTGLTQADLDAYAAQLQSERAQLDDYRQQLIDVAAVLQQRANTGVATASAAKPAAKQTKAKPKAVAKPKAAAKPKAVAKPKVAKVAKPAPAPAPRPQAQTQGS